MTVRVGVLHTVPALVPVFDALLRERLDDLHVLHVADAQLLAESIAAGEADDHVREKLERHLAAFRDAGADAVLVTCSSIGEMAEAAGDAAGMRVVRVDAAMARQAVRAAVAAGRARGERGRILVLATLAATLGPTGRLVAAAVGNEPVSVSAHVVDHAAEARAAGDQAGHDRLVAGAVRDADADVIVLAQASMAPAAGDDPRVLTSPESGTADFVARLGPAG